MILPVTLCAVAAAAVINIWLSVRIGQLRQAYKVSVGDGGVEALQRRMRAQLNFVENTPVVLVMIIAIEFARPGNAWLTGVAGVYMLGRVAHGLGMDGSKLGVGRTVGTLVTMLTQLGLAIWAVSIVLDM